MFIGPSDLSAALGHLGKPGHADVQQAIEGAIGRIRAPGRAAGILATDEAQARLRAGAGEGRVLGHEPVAGIDRVGSDLDRSLDDQLRVEVGADGVAGAADLVALIRLEAVNRVAVLGNVDGDAADAELIGCAKRADRDLAAVCDQQRPDHPRLRDDTRPCYVSVVGAVPFWSRPLRRRRASEPGRPSGRLPTRRAARRWCRRPRARASAGASPRRRCPAPWRGPRALRRSRTRAARRPRGLRP